MSAPPRNHHPNQPSTSKPPKPTQPNNPLDPNPNNPTAPPSSSSSPFTLSQQDIFLSRASHLTRHELLKRRSHNLKQLSKCYRDHYWALMEEVKSQYRDYYWNFGVSAFKEDQNQNKDTLLRKSGKDGSFMGGDGGYVKVEEVSGENVVSNCSDVGGINNNRCLFVGCSLKAMALTSFCHLHILSDANQKLYEPCAYVIKRPQAGPLTCGKPILRSTTPALCALHFQNAQKHVNRALKKAGLPSASTKVAPKFHVVIAEYVRQIQAKRRVTKRRYASNGVGKEPGANVS